MTKRMLFVSFTAFALFVALIAWVVASSASSKAAPQQRSEFAQQVDLTPLKSIAVYDQGTLKSFDSFASSMMTLISGPHAINGHTDAYAYLDIMLRSQAYTDVDAIYVKNKPVRSEIADALAKSLDETLPVGQIADQEKELRTSIEQRLQRFIKTGLISSQMLFDTKVQVLLEEKSRDLKLTARLVQQIRTGQSVMQARVLADNLRIVPPPGTSTDVPWLTVDNFLASHAHEASAEGEQLHTQMQSAWTNLSQNWQGQDAVATNEAVAQLASLMPQVNANLYPQQERLSWESWYFSARNMTWIWMIYLMSIVFLLMGIAYKWNTARWLGFSVFTLAFALQTAAIILRWYVSGRWPNSNMFEAVTTSAWFGGCGAVFLEVFARKSAMRGLFALSSAVGSMIALMCAHFMPVQLNPNISNMMPVLHDVWLYIHTNVIIFSYLLIVMAAVTAVLYLIYRVGGGKPDHVRVGGAGSMIIKTPTGDSYLADAKSSAGQIFDGATMVLMELAFILLWAGLVMGAIWADHSWGRPWGWDPKEVFALNTFIILALLVHVRIKVKDKGLWTAFLAIAGCAVMLFNWIAINFLIVGLHSYA